MNRSSKILSKVSKSGRGIEIGPGYNPLVSKADGWDVLVVDHASKADIVEKYKKIGIDTSRVQDTDVIWHGGPLHDAVPAELHGSFDYCIASHVIEHIPNPILFFDSLSHLLAPGGVISLAIPDKRYCFDFFQPLTSTADFLAAWRRDARTHSNRAIFQHGAYTVRTRDGQVAWGESTLLPPLEFFTPDLHKVYERFLNVSDSPDSPYEDCHGWHFTPASFALIHLELSQLGLLPFSLAISYPTVGCEFFITLSNQPPQKLSQDAFTEARLALLRQLIKEQAQQLGSLEPNPMELLKKRLVSPLLRTKRALNRLYRRVTA